MRLAQTVVITVNRTLEWSLFTSQPKWNATRFISRFSSILPTVVSHEIHIENDAEIQNFELLILDNVQCMLTP